MMKFSALAIAVGAPLFSMAQAGVKSGHAEAALLAASAGPGQAIPVGIRLTIEEGWHSYWINPGEGGMPLKATWTLPEGWTAGPLQQPVPKRFMTGDLPGFGYEKEAVFVTELTPPSGGKAEGEAKVKLSWLTCNDSACVPGDVELTLKLPVARAEAAELSAATKKIPTPLEGAALQVSEAAGKLKLELTAPASVDLTGAAAFPATPQVVDAGAPLTFKKDGAKWSASIAKNEYADGPAKELQIVLAGGNLERPVSVTWQAKK